MSDILPKFRMYFFICVIIFLTNVVVTLCQMSFSLTNIIALTVGSFVPFVSLVSLVGNDFPSEFTLFVGAIFTILSVIQVFLILMFVFQSADNLLWHPDV